MPRNPARLLRGAAAVPILLLFAVSCNPEKKLAPQIPSDYLPQSSPRNCLLNLETAYIQRNLDEYTKLFPLDFTFMFSPADAGRIYDPTPPSWGYSEERESTYKLFTSATVTKIELDWGETAPADSAFDEYPDTWKIVQGGINLRVHVTNEDGTPLVYSVDSAVDWFYFKEYPREKASDGQPLWRIWQWRDQPPRAVSGLTDPARRPQSQETSWGTIKNLYK
jgi:hypothetical protein